MSKNCNSGDLDPGMFLEWSQKAGVPWLVALKAPDPRKRSTIGHSWFGAAEGRPPLNEISLLKGRVFLARARPMEKAHDPTAWNMLRANALSFQRNLEPTRGRWKSDRMR